MCIVNTWMVKKKKTLMGKSKTEGIKAWDGIKQLYFGSSTSKNLEKPKFYEWTQSRSERVKLVMLNIFILKRFCYSKAAEKKLFIIRCRAGLSLKKSPASQEIMRFQDNNSFPGFSRRLTPQKCWTMIAIIDRTTKKKPKRGNAVQKSHTNERLAPKIKPK